VDAPGLPVVAGVRPVTVSRRVDGRIVARGLATVRVRRSVPVWVTARDVPAGSVLAADDVRVEPRDFEREPAREQTGDFVPGAWTARHALSTGAVVRSTDVTRHPDVEAGTPLNLVVRAGEARVSVPSIARRSGNIGQTILVSNPVTGALVSAVLVDAATAELTRPAGPGPVANASGGSAP
jgi:flagella basal body P-ring formation protein FlgA